MATKRTSSGSSGSGEIKREAKGRPRLRSSHGQPPPSRESLEAFAPRTSARPKRAAAPAAGSAPAKAKAKAPAAGGPKVRKTTRSESRADVAPLVASEEARALATAIAVAALEKKAVGLEILDVAGRVDYADFLVLMTGRSDRQVVALSQGIEEALQKQNRRPLSVEGLPHANWVLMDYGDVVVHVFQDETRGLYDLEGLWLDARRLPVPLPDDAPRD